MANIHAYPVRVDALLDTRMSRWLWLVKWLLLIPHYVVLAFLWVAFIVTSVVAFFGILITGTYPRAIFTFNVGVLRWTWRVQYYAIGAFGTDRYPPFTLADVPDYPAHLEVAYPDRLSRGLVLVKWWLLAIPQYIVVALFLGGGGNIGLIGVLAVIAAVILLFTRKYPEQIFDFVLGLNRWVLRVAAYAALMTDEYPPFRLDMGPHEPGGTFTVPDPPPVQPEPTPAWTAPRIISVVVGSLLALCSLGLVAGGGVATWADTAHRDSGYVGLGSDRYQTAGFAVVGEADWDGPDSLIGTLRLRVTSTTGDGPIFVGLAPRDAANDYLEGVRYATVGDDGTSTPSSGTAPATGPTEATFWTEQAVGTGVQTLTWDVRDSDWTFVAMRADGSELVDVDVEYAATMPSLNWVAVGAFATGLLLLIGSAALITIPIVNTRSSSRRRQ